MVSNPEFENQVKKFLRSLCKNCAYHFYFICALNKSLYIP